LRRARPRPGARRAHRGPPDPRQAAVDAAHARDLAPRVRLRHHPGGALRMRGITGWATTLPRSAPDEGVLLDMASSVAHRNASCEDLKAVFDRTLRRQVVLAASLADAQSRISLVLDGSILNFDELKAQLGKRGYHFTANTHEELLLQIGRASCRERV